MLGLAAHKPKCHLHQLNVMFAAAGSHSQSRLELTVRRMDFQARSTGLDRGPGVPEGLPALLERLSALFWSLTCKTGYSQEVCHTLTQGFDGSLDS